MTMSSRCARARVHLSPGAVSAGSQVLQVCTKSCFWMLLVRLESKYFRGNFSKGHVSSILASRLNADPLGWRAMARRDVRGRTGLWKSWRVL